MSKQYFLIGTDGHGNEHAIKQVNRNDRVSDIQVKKLWTKLKIIISNVPDNPKRLHFGLSDITHPSNGLFGQTVH